MEKFNFSGWATKNNIKCSDGRTILKDAFKEYDGKTVPLVWAHQHSEPANVLGHALLENREEGVYTYGFFNDSDNGIAARKAVEHGDIKALSIYANRLKQHGDSVVHGDILEVSLVLAGANIGAFIDAVMAHSDDSELSATIYTGEEFELYHSEETPESKDNTMQHENKEETIADVFETLNEKQKTVVYALIAEALAGEDSEEEIVDNKDVQHEDTGETIADVFNSMTEKQKTVVYAMIGEALGGVDDKTVEHSDENNNNNNNNNLEGGKNSMKKNVFENNDTNETTDNATQVLSHDELATIVADVKRCGTLKEAFLAHGITNIDYLFPEARTVGEVPSFITRDQTWVTKVMNGIHKTPFSRIKSVHADITADEARAKGYIKGNLKTDEVFTLLKRTTTPTTVYKKQKLDRDDVVDITDIDVVALLKGEMRLMLDEEIAGAILVGDGRLSSSDDKINETNIRPIWADPDLYTIKKNVVIDPTATEDQAAKAFIKSCVKVRKQYKGSGNPTLFTTEDWLTVCLLMEDTTGRTIYETMEKLASAMRVKEIITVPVMENRSRTDGVLGSVNLMGIMVNLADYNVGADKGGAINMFEDFDIDYNAQKYLIETRCSGALTRPYSAVAFETTYTLPA